jgi:hypothetical protein
MRPRQAQHEENREWPLASAIENEPDLEQIIDGPLGAGKASWAIALTNHPFPFAPQSECAFGIDLGFTEIVRARHLFENWQDL